MPVNKGQQIYVGYVAAALVIVALMRRGARRGATTVRSAPSPALRRAHYEQEENANQ